MNRLDRFCEAIMSFEGWRPGSRSYRNCNPGNMRWSPVMVRQDDGYAVFNTFADGWFALLKDVSIKASGKSRHGIGPSSSILEFFKVYAPSKDSNHPELYAAYVIDRARLPIDCTLAELLKYEGGDE